MKTLRLAWQGLGTWPGRTWAWALVASAGTAVLIGVPTVMIPNNIFGRDIPVVWWNYPVWILTSLLAGMLIATYIRTGPSKKAAQASAAEAVSADDGTDSDDDLTDPTSQKQGKLAIGGSLLGWFAVGCPVCNKFALLALGYSGAITWFAPIQPFLGLAGLGLTAAALLLRLRGLVSCPLPNSRTKTAHTSAKVAV